MHSTTQRILLSFRLQLAVSDGGEERAGQAPPYVDNPALTAGLNCNEPPALGAKSGDGDVPGGNGDARNARVAATRETRMN